MFKCNICKREFNSIKKLVAHLSHPKSSCKTNIQEYYNKYLRKTDEGICIYCGRETSFAGLSKGYPNNKCKHCRNNASESKILRRQNSIKKQEKRKIDRGYYQLQICCEICGMRFKDRHGLAKHISQKHKDVSLQNYYDQHFKKDKEDICPITGEKTNFKSLVHGYYRYCGTGTNSADLQIKEKKKLTLFKNFGVTNSQNANKEKRIINYKQTIQKRKNIYNKRKNLIDLLRMLTIENNNKLQCQFCGRCFINHGSISIHITKGHKVSLQTYYDTFFKKDQTEGICPVSNLNTNFDCLERGYYKYHKSIITCTPEIKNGSKQNQLNYIKSMVLKEQPRYNVKIKNIDSLNTIGDLTTYKCTLCSNEYETRFTYLRSGFGKCQICFPRNTHKSKGEIEVYDFIKSIYPKDILTSYTQLIKNPITNKNLELDIFLPEKKLAIEFNGLYWHSECILDNPEKYHSIKLNECNKKGIKLINIFEDEWYYKKDIIKYMLEYKIGNANCKKVHGRKCIIKDITSKEKNIFLNSNHIQGSDNSSVRIGAFYLDKLIAVMTFSIAKTSYKLKINDSWELSRFSVLIGYSIPGIASKILSYFKKKYKWYKIHTYADLRWSEGDLYYKIGFDFIKKYLPNYWYISTKIPNKRIHRFNLRKTPDEPKSIPEWMLRHEQGYYRIWDCGIAKFEIINKLYI